MPFLSTAYGSEVAALLALDGDGERPMPLAGGTCTSAEAARRLASAAPSALFPAARAPEAALAGLYLYFSCLDECHSLAQRIETPEGSFWHAILHRQEPDAANSAYWFRRVGSHPIFPELREAAARCGYPAGQAWDPFAFIDYCERARSGAGPETGRIAMKVQLREWQLLFDWCAR
jgi:hypothetical protein